MKPKKETNGQASGEIERCLDELDKEIERARIVRAHAQALNVAIRETRRTTRPPAPEPR
jgi:hypothetical protein